MFIRQDKLLSWITIWYEQVASSISDSVIGVNRAWTQSKSPLLQAMCRGMLPPWSWISRVAPATTNLLTMWAFLVKTAKCKGVWRWKKKKKEIYNFYTHTQKETNKTFEISYS